MRVFETTADLDACVGQTVGSSRWLTIDQERIDLFARATGDDQWIHTDVDRASRDMPEGKTIAHGYLLLSLLPLLFRDVFTIERRSRSINYGSNKVRFLLPVPVDGQICLSVLLRASDANAGGRRFTFENTLRLEGTSRPAMVAETVSISYD